MNVRISEACITQRREEEDGTRDMGHGVSVEFCSTAMSAPACGFLSSPQALRL